MIPRPSSKVITAIALVLLPLLYFYPAVIGEVALVPGDGWTQNFGVRVLIGQMIAHGILPLWNPYIFAGTPLLASIYPGALYPPNWLFALFSPGVAMNIVVITTYHLALIGSYLYARRIGMGRIGALTTGVIFTFSGYMIAHLGHTSRIAAAAWLPWVLLAIENLYLRASWRWISLGVLFVALQLFAGEPQMNCYTVLVGGAYGLFSLTLRKECEQRQRFAAAAAVMAVGGLLLSMIQLLPERELLQHGERAKITYDYFSQFSLPPRQVLGLIFPYFFGGAAMGPYKVSYWGQWNSAETCGYVGILGLLLGLIAVLGSQRRSLVWFWAGAAIGSLILAFGSYLPFGLNRLLYDVPVYNLFRASARNLFEFTFAAAVLAGLGINCLAQMEPKQARRIFVRSTAALAIIITVATIIYRFFLPRLVVETPLPAQAGSLLNPDAFFPLIAFAVSVAALWFYVQRRSSLAGLLVVAVLAADLAAFGYAFDWRIMTFSANKRVADPPSVQFIKQREPDINAFRILSHSLQPYAYHYDMLDHPNVGIARGLQSINGYDALRLPRLAAVAGEMSLDGYVEDASAFNDAHQGFNLLGVKYLFHERPAPIEPWRGLVLDGIRFSETPLGLKFSPGTHLEMTPDEMTVTDLAIISTMGNSTHLPDGSPVLGIKLHTKDGRVIERELQAGRDTGEWAYDRPDARAMIKHHRPRIAESWGGGGFEAHRYFARVSFEPSQIERIELDYLRPDAALEIFRASLHDVAAGTSTPLDSLDLSPQRWRKLASFGQVDLYENLKLMPRAWFAKRVQAELSVAVLRAIKQGRLKDESPFDPAETALLEIEDFGGREITLPPTGDTKDARVAVTRYEPQRIELRTHNPQPGFLVLSEVYYRGWDAWIDGQKAPVYRTDYTLRGLAIPSGEHRVEFIFRAPTFFRGAAYSGLGIVLLLIGAVASRSRTSQRLAAQVGHLLTSHLRLTIVIVGMLIYGSLLATHASFAVGGADSSGYANAARSILKGEITLPITMLERLDLPESFSSIFAPLAYSLGPRPKTISSFYPVGFPLHVAVAALIGGWEKGPFLLSPLLALLSVVLIYLVGLELGLSRNFSLVGAVILALCPTFVFMALQPMSDVAATFWALAAIWAALRSQRQTVWAVAAGAAFGIAFLVRPTNVFLTLPLLFCLRLKPQALLFFFLGGLPFAGIFFAYNNAAYGHPWQTGYGAINLQAKVMTQNFTVRFNHYLSWLAKTLSPLLLLGWLGVAVNRRVDWKTRALLITWFGTFLLFYSCYDHYEAWWFTRFLLPGIPAIILGALLSARDISGFLQRFAAWRNGVSLRRAVGCVLFLVVLGYEQRTISRFEVLGIGADQDTHPASCKWADRTLPPQSLVISGEMSGALKFYTNRPCVRWDQIDSADQWQMLERRAAEKGYQWYALLMPHEIELAQSRVIGHWTQLGSLRNISLWQIEPSGSQ